jgi:hypothetical protein
MCFCQAADFADRVASGVLTTDVAAEVERLRARSGEVGRGEQKPLVGGEGGRIGGREDGPSVPAGRREEGGEPGRR